jgi:hypothetical protein
MKSFNISNIAGGALVEQVDAEIQKVLSNIADVNTDPMKKRKITICLIFEGDNEREIADVSFETKSTLVPSRKQTTRIAFEKHKNSIIAEELGRGQIRGQAKIDNETGEIVEPLLNSKVVNMNK